MNYTESSVLFLRREIQYVKGDEIEISFRQALSPEIAISAQFRSTQSVCISLDSPSGMDLPGHVREM